MNEIHSFVLSQDISTIVIGLFVIIYGMAYGIRNWFVRLFYMFQAGTWNQTMTGRILDVSWFVSVLWLVVVFCKG